jgi:hypothetical protein
MITNFEDITQDLTKEELVLLPIFVSAFANRTESNPIKSADIVDKMNAYLVSKAIDMKITGVKVRKFVNHIRSNAILPVIATSKGYYVSHDQYIIMTQMKSLNQRARSILQCVDGLANFISR